MFNKGWEVIFEAKESKRMPEEEVHNPPPPCPLNRNNICSLKENGECEYLEICRAALNRSEELTGDTRFLNNCSQF
jgi:hypothetical protein